MNDSIGMNYCAPDANVWAVNLDGRYMSAVQNYLVADGIPTDGVTKIVSNALRLFRIVLTQKELVSVKKQVS